MIDLERHITRLLLSNDCVILPDFGGFVAHYLGASYNEGEGRFYPPRRMIGFNPQLTMNDSLLVQSVAESLNTSYPEALQHVEESVSALRHELDEHGGCDIGGIGTLRLTAAGKYDFEPCDAGLLTPSLYGLDAFEAALLGNEAAGTSEPQVNTDDNAGKTRRQIPLWVVRDIAAVCLAIVLFSLIPHNGGRHGESMASMVGSAEAGMIVDMTRQEAAKAFPKNTVVRKTGAEDASTDTVSTMTERKCKTAKTASTTPQDFYTIVLASRVSPKGAAEYVAKLHARGLSEAEAMHSGNVTSVVFGKFEKRDEAQRRLRELNDDVEFADSWIKLVNRNTGSGGQ